jgi:peptidoglycan/LPS O-acetylase OafA/YrhL
LIALVYFKIIKKGGILILLLFVLGLLARWYSWHILASGFADKDDYWVYWYKFIYYPTYSRLDGLLTGVSIAAIFQFRPQLKNRLQQYGNYLLVAGLFVLTGAYFLCLNEQSFAAAVFGFPLISIGYGLIVTAAISPSCILYQFKSVTTTRIASLSYAIYLTHKIVTHICQEQFVKLNIGKHSNGMLFICIAASLLAACLLNIIIEKPFLRLREKILMRRKA